MLMNDWTDCFAGNIDSFDKGETPYHYARDQNGNVELDDELGLQCPPHTTERKLMTKIDLHVVPFLCILYLLAFLDR